MPMTRRMYEAHKKRWNAAQFRWRMELAADRLDLAREEWRRLGRGREGRQRQVSLIHELIETRQFELRKAYPDLLGIGVGKGTREGKEAESPCLIFMVRRKRKRLEHHRRLPSHLFAYTTLQDRRVLCSIPTDVEEQHAYRHVKAHGSETLYVSSGDSGSIPAMLTSPVRIRYANGSLDKRLYAVSCLHVLGMVQQFYPSLGPNCDFRPDNASKRIGTLSGYYGIVQPASDGFSFDAALGVVDNTNDASALLRRVLPDPWPKNRIFGVDDIPDDALILCNNSKNPIQARKQTTWFATSMPVTYDTPNGPISAIHADLVEWNASTVGGDSGSPVVAADDRDLLLGMHIAGDKSGTALMIPAYNLFNSVHFTGDVGMTMEIPSNF